MSAVKVTIRNIDIRRSQIDWPCNHGPTEPKPAVVTTKKTRKKIHGYTCDDVRLFGTIEEAVEFEKGRRQFAALVDFHDGSYKILCWLDDNGKRFGRLGVTEQKLQHIQAYRRVIYIIRSSITTDDVVYVGQSTDVERRAKAHLSAARSGQKPWEQWMAHVVAHGGELQVDCVDAIEGTFFHAQTLEEIWRKVMILKGYRPYLYEEKLEEQRAALMDDVPHQVAHRYSSSPIEPFSRQD